MEPIMKSGWYQKKENPYNFYYVSLQGQIYKIYCINYHSRQSDKNFRRRKLFERGMTIQGNLKSKMNYLGERGINLYHYSTKYRTHYIIVLQNTVFFCCTKAVTYKLGEMKKYNRWERLFTVIDNDTIHYRIVSMNEKDLKFLHSYKRIKPSEMFYVPRIFVPLNDEITDVRYKASDYETVREIIE